MKKILNSLGVSLYNKLHASSLKVEPYINNFGYILFIVYPSFYVFNLCFTLSPNEENLFLRIVIGFFGILLITREKWVNRVKIPFPILWYFVLWFSVPFFFMYMLLQNQTSNIWQINGLVGLAILTFFVDWIEFVILTFCAFVVAILLCKVLDPYFYFHTKEFIGIVGSYSPPLIYFIVFFQRKEIEHKKEMEYLQKLETLKALGGSIAHELRTPVGALGMKGMGIANQANKLLETYKVAREHNLPIKELREKEIKTIEASYKDIENVTSGSLLIIDMLLTKLKDPSKESHKEIYSIKQVVEEAIDKYPLYENQRDLIKLHLGDDFSFYGNKTMITHVIFNLLKNALHYIRQANKGEITITSKQDRGNNILYFKDTAKGIPTEMLPHMFEKFYSKTEHGTGLGLAFCKLVMEEIEGKITCESVYGEYTKFVLLFSAQSNI
jgi:signal transduction histidine kinase